MERTSAESFSDTRGDEPGWRIACGEYYNGMATVVQGIQLLVPVGQSYDYNDFAGLIFLLVAIRVGLVAAVAGLGHAAAARRLLRPCRLLRHAQRLADGLCRRHRNGRHRLPRLSQTMAAAGDSPVLAAVVWMALPADRRNRYLTLYDPEAGVATGESASAGNYRLNGLETAWPMFTERPLLGYGPMGFMAEKGWLPHNLYGQLLAELGIAGTVAFALMLFGVALNVVEARRDRAADFSGGRLARSTVVAVGAAYLVLAIMSWGFNFLFWQVWLWFGGFQLVALQLLKSQAEEAPEEEAAESENAWQEAAIEA